MFLIVRLEIKISLTDCKSSKHSYNLADAKTGSASKAKWYLEMEILLLEP